jgi:hypothetical protein
MNRYITNGGLFMVNAMTSSSTPELVSEQLYCTLTGKPISQAEAYWAPPLVTARELVAAIFSNLRTPSNLSHVLFGEQANVPYAQEARELLAQRRNAEQLKLLVGLLVVVALIILPILMLAFR